MPKYKFEAYDLNGVTVVDTVVAPSREAALVTLQQSGMMVGRIRPAFSAKVSGRSVSNKEFHQFNQEMIALVRAGIPVVEALGMCIPRPGSQSFSAVLGEVKKKVSEGQSLSDACKDFPEAFDSIYVASARTGEQTGELKDSLVHYQHYLNRKIVIEREVKQALYYPLFLLIALAVALTVLFIYVIPKFAALYEGFDMELPFATQVILAVANATPLTLGILGGLAITAAFAWNLFEKPPHIALFIDKLLLATPVLGGTRAMLHQARLMTMLNGLLSTGTPLVSALRIASASFGGLGIGVAMGFVAKEVEEGGRFSAAISRQKVLSDQVIKMLDTGENAGALEHMMKEVAVYSEELLDEKLKRLTSLFEPVLMSIIGLLIGFVIVAMYMPIFFLAEVIQ